MQIRFCLMVLFLAFVLPAGAQVTQEPACGVVFDVGVGGGNVGGSVGACSYEVSVAVGWALNPPGGQVRAYISGGYGVDLPGGNSNAAGAFPTWNTGQSGGGPGASAYFTVFPNNKQTGGDVYVTVSTDTCAPSVTRHIHFEPCPGSAPGGGGGPGTGGTPTDPPPPTTGDPTTPPADGCSTLCSCLGSVVTNEFGEFWDKLDGGLHDLKDKLVDGLRALLKEAFIPDQDHIDRLGRAKEVIEGLTPFKVAHDLTFVLVKPADASPPGGDYDIAVPIFAPEVDPNDHSLRTVRQAQTVPVNFHESMQGGDPADDAANSRWRNLAGTFVWLGFMGTCLAKLFPRQVV
jgi:hypothetical protein